MVETGRCVTSREAALLFLAHYRRIPPPTGAVIIGGSLRAIGVDSHGLSLEVGVRVSPHMGVVFINEGIVGIEM